MRLSARARHAVRLMVEVYRHGKGARPVNLTEVAGITGISKRFLEQVAAGLKSHELLRGVSGRRGGYLLGRPATEITVGEVLSAAAGPMNVPICVAEPEMCMASEFCGCVLMWRLLALRIEEVLDGWTIADLADEDSLASLRKQIIDVAASRSRQSGSSDAGGGEGKADGETTVRG